jgi:Questin oxidase-like
VDRPATDWTKLLGRPEAFGALKCTFAAALSGNRRDAVLRDAINILIFGVGASAFHGAIRVAYAIESNHRGELAAALAYWAAYWAPLASPWPVEPDLDGVANWLNAIDTQLQRNESDWRSKAISIDARMHDATQTAAYLFQAGRLRVANRNPGVLLCELALEGARRYVATRDFTILHIATAARAARVLLSWLPKRPDALDPLWHAVAAASISSRMDLDQSPPRAVGMAANWDEILRVARASDDEHVIKLVHAMATQNAVAPDPAWLQAAAAAVKEA